MVGLWCAERKGTDGGHSRDFMRSAGTAVTRCINSTTNKKNTFICLDANVPKSEGVSCLLMFTRLSMCIIMLTCFRLTASISVLSSADPLESSRLESANMDWLLHFQKSQSSPNAPWLLNRGSQESRGEAAICISHGAWRPHCCRGRERETATSVYLSQRKREKMSEGRILGRLTQSLSALKVLPLFLLPPYFPPIYWLLHCSLPFLSAHFFFWLFFFFFFLQKAWPCMAAGPD